MRNFILGLFLLIVAVGCSTTKPVPKLPPVEIPKTPQSAPVVAGQLTKDGTVVGAANNIDTIVEGTPQQPAVNEQTETIRQAVEKNPAADVAKIASEYEAVISALKADNGNLRSENQGLRNANAKLTEENADLKDSRLRWVTGSLLGLGALITAAGVAISIYGTATKIGGLWVGVAVAGAGLTLSTTAVLIRWALQNMGWVAAGVVFFLVVAGSLAFANHRWEAKTTAK